LISSREGSSDVAIPSASLLDVPEGKRTAFMEETTEATHFFKRETFFYFPAGAAEGDSVAIEDEPKIRLGRN
jgi:hypothetical protein